MKMDESTHSLSRSGKKMGKTVISKLFLKLLFSFVFADIDECAISNGGCEQLCTNLPGTYECSCISGYHKSKDSKRCEGM